MYIERRYDIDWLRVIAITLLLIYHISIVFQPWAMFIAFIRSDEISTAIWQPMTLLNIWRIPILFYVSGMGVYFALRKRNNIELLIERSKRILLPFLFGVVAISPLHMFVFQDYYNLGLNYYPQMGHLWFLGNIFIYVLLGLPIFYGIKKGMFLKLLSFSTRLFNNPLGLLAVNVFFVAEVLIFQPKPFALYAQTWHGFAIGLLAFFFGFLFMQTGKVFWNTVKQWKWLFLGLAAILYTVRYVVFATEGPLYLISIESNCWIFSIFGFCYQYLNKPSKALSYLSKAAYPVYIIHMVVLYLAAKFILPFHLPALIAFILIILITFVGCYLLYEFIIRRISILRPLFGLDWKFKNVIQKQLKRI
ncbi:Surface polysaccharide O-acyltransferase, integral membrane enzyme [Lutibacter oricola]|uniref:Surface polysaccharide O-acyltransferase, integral membrane enzyme n=1 Tax=Lutibacter oricola TaxID=762486 RepID=A0A1H2SQK9_9FLAO|nr:acyltransferase family protein [Lutibacter oricola]SDW33926.1 Surface polysaccharide O-acyltransferase, integral membrane enzyme [Lutibacter oricola]